MTLAASGVSDKPADVGSVLERWDFARDHSNALRDGPTRCIRSLARSAML